MKNQGLKTKISVITLILLLIISAILVILPFVNAQETKSKMTYAFIGATPNPVGVNQEVLLFIGVTDYLRQTEDGWEGLTVTVTDPSGGEEVLGPYRTDSTGATGGVFVPSMVGTYTLQTHFPAQWYNFTGWVGTRMPRYIEDYIFYEASVSEPLELIVQEDPIEYYPGHSLPSEYWTRPIDAQLREWNTIAGSWLVSTPANSYVPYNDGPETAHILWAKPLTTGGLVGGEVGNHAFGCGDAYEGKWPTRFIVAGKLYYTEGGTRSDELTVTYCVDLHTGEELWNKVFMDNQSIAFCQLLYWTSYNYHGAFAYLYVSTGGNWYIFDAYDGVWRFTIENVPSGTTIYGPNGEIYILSVSTGKNWMALWNMTNLCLSAASGYSGGSWGNTVHANVFDAESNGTANENGWTMNVTIPSGLPGRVSVAGFGDRVVGTSVSNTEVTVWGLSLADGDEGDLLFNETWDAPDDWVSGNLTVAATASSLEDGVVVVRARETRSFYGFSTETGEYLWGPTEMRPFLDAYVGGFSGEYGKIADGKLFSGTMGGIMYCHDVKTGNLLWTYEFTDPYSEILWSNYWPIEFGFITDGKVYLFHTEHSVVDPKPRGAPFVCIDIETGNEVFRADGLVRSTVWGGDPIIGDSIIAMYNSYDQRIVTMGKGPSETTVSIQNDVVNLGSQVMVTGTVMDVSPSTEDTEITLRFPSGVPAVSDASMSEWMKHVYQQFERPADTTGATVKLCAIDPNGNYQDLGTTTSDSYGNYGLMFEPEIEGQYMIIASFDGSGGYYGSTATTYLGVCSASASTPIEPDENPDETPDKTPDETPDGEVPESLLISTELAIVAAVAVACVIGVVAYWALRRRG